MSSSSSSSSALLNARLLQTVTHPQQTLKAYETASLGSLRGTLPLQKEVLDKCRAMATRYRDMEGLVPPEEGLPPMATRPISFVFSNLPDILMKLKAELREARASTQSREEQLPTVPADHESRMLLTPVQLCTRKDGRIVKLHACPLGYCAAEMGLIPDEGGRADTDFSAYAGTNMRSFMGEYLFEGAGARTTSKKKAGAAGSSEEKSAGGTVDAERVTFDPDRRLMAYLSPAQLQQVLETGEQPEPVACLYCARRAVQTAYNLQKQSEGPEQGGFREGFEELGEAMGGAADSAETAAGAAGAVEQTLSFTHVMKLVPHQVLVGVANGYRPECTTVPIAPEREPFGAHDIVQYVRTTDEARIREVMGEELYRAWERTGRVETPVLLDQRAMLWETGRAGVRDPGTDQWQREGGRLASPEQPSPALQSKLMGMAGLAPVTTTSTTHLVEGAWGGEDNMLKIATVMADMVEEGAAHGLAAADPSAPVRPAKRARRKFEGGIGGLGQDRMRELVQRGAEGRHGATVAGISLSPETDF